MLNALEIVQTIMSIVSSISDHKKQQQLKAKIRELEIYIEKIRKRQWIISFCFLGFGIFLGILIGKFVV